VLNQLVAVPVAGRHRPGLQQQHQLTFGRPRQARGIGSHRLTRQQPRRRQRHPQPRPGFTLEHQPAPIRARRRPTAGERLQLFREVGGSEADHPRGRRHHRPRA
jgi:hypothetical protein